MFKSAFERGSISSTAVERLQCHSVLRDLFVCESVDLGIEQYYLEQADGPV